MRVSTSDITGKRKGSGSNDIFEKCRNFTRPKEVFDAAVRALAAGDYETAERGFQSVLREQPRQIAALSNLGVIYSRTNRADKAIAVYRRALEVSPNDKAILLNLGLVYLDRKSTRLNSSHLGISYAVFCLK